MERLAAAGLAPRAGLGLSELAKQRQKRLETLQKELQALEKQADAAATQVEVARGRLTTATENHALFLEDQKQAQEGLLAATLAAGFSDADEAAAAALPAAELQAMGQVYNADDPDLSAFTEAGGKMIVWHGWADAIVTPYKTVEWYDALAGASGGEETIAEHVRLFMIPGMDHCGIQPGPDGIDQSSLDLLTRLEEWVEEGMAPETVMKDE